MTELSRPSESGASSPTDSLFERLVEQLEADPAFDVDAFLAEHAEHASQLLERLEKLQLVDLRPGEPNQGEAGALMDLLATQPLGAVPPAFRGSGGDRYELLEALADGGMGTVYLARDRDLDREVAIKTVRLRSAANGSPSTLALRLRRFLNEARVTGLLEHPNIVPVHDLGVLPNGKLFFAMKLVEGVTWTEHLGRADGHPDRTWSARRLRDGISVLLKVCDAVAFAHQRGVVHRDLKPDNIMIGRFGEVQVMDWGLVKILEDSEAAASERLIAASDPEGDSPRVLKTSTGSVFGTPAFMAPEQARGDTDAIGPHTDIFCLGGLLHFLLRGSAPYRGGSRSAVIELAKRGAITPPPGAPRELAAILRRAMATEPARRYADVAAFAADLRAYLEDQPGVAWRESLGSRARKLVRRKPAQAIAIAAALMVALAAWAAWSANQAASAQEELNTALVAESERRERFFDFERAQASGFAEDVPPSGSPAGAIAILQAMVSRLRSIDIPIQAGAGADQVLDALQEAQRYHSTVGEVAFAVIIDLEQLLRSQNLRSAWEWKNGELPERMSERGRATCEKLYAENQGLADLWPLIRDLERRLQPGSWQAAFRKESESWYRTREVDFEALRSSVDYPVDRANDLFRLAILSRNVWKRGLEKPDQHPEELGQTAFQMADSAFRHAANLNLGNYWLHEAATDFLFAVNTPDSLQRAWWHTELALRAKPDSAVALDRLATLLLTTGRDPIRAAELARHALEIDPATANAYSNLAEALFRAGDHAAIAEALPLLDQGADRFPNSVGLARNQGRCLFRLERFDDARIRFKSALRVAPERYDIWAELGDTLNHLDDFEGALVASERALAGGPTVGAVSTRLEAMLSLDRERDAVDFARGLFEHDQDGAWLHLLASSLLVKGRPELAVAIYGEAVEAMPANLDLPWERAEALLAADQPEKAAGVIETALRGRLDAWAGRRQPQEWAEFRDRPESCILLLDDWMAQHQAGAGTEQIAAVRDRLAAEAAAALRREAGN